MLDDLIAGWVEASARSHDRLVALRLQRIARIAVVPAAALMLAGLLAFGLSGASGEQPGVIPPAALFGRAILTPFGAMSAGLLALVLLPMINVLYILVDRVVTKRWPDVAAAAVVAGILILGIFLGRK